MQSVTIEGYLAADPSILSAQGSGKRRASFRLIETTRFRKADGQPGERTTGFNCVCFSEATAEAYIAPFARKGSRVVVQGHVENDTWTGRDGRTHFDLRLVVRDMRIKTRRNTESNGCGEATPPELQFDHDDEIPF